jgi:hypothetical protein
MKLAIMQPYFFPYIGYFQLINLCDHFVVYDDVQYIKNGWINRNRILINSAPSYITLPVERNAPHSATIQERYFNESFEKDKTRILRTIQQAYARAPYLSATMELLQECFLCRERNVADFLTHCLRLSCQYLKLDKPFTRSSTLQLDSNLKGQARVIAVNLALGASHYINPIGGIELYEREHFRLHGQQLSFIRSRETSYKQFSDAHVPFLSMIDVMMFNSVDEIQGLLQEFDLLPAQERSFLPQAQ